MSFPNSDALTLIRDLLLLLKEEPVILALPEDASYFRARQRIYQEGLKNREQAKEAAQIFCSGASSFVREQSASVDKEFAAKLTHAKTNFSIASGMPQPSLMPQVHAKETPPPSDRKPESLSPKPEMGELSIAPQPIPAESTPFHDPAVGFTTPPPQPLVKESPRHSSSLFRSILQKVAPELAILDSIPSDTTAIQLANRWKTKNQSAPISILSCQELPQHQVLLREIATALDVYFGPARLIEATPIEKEKQWKAFLSVATLKLIVICDSTLWQLHNLRQFYKETPATGVRMLGDVPIFLLPDLSLYLKDPQLKRSLWKALCSKLHPNDFQKLEKCLGGALNLSQAQPTPKQLNLNKLSDAGGLKFSGCPTPAGSNL